MGVLKNQRHEAFARYVALENLSHVDAHEKAGYRRCVKNCDRLFRRPDIAARIRELAARAADKAEWTQADRLSALARIANKTEGKDPRVAVSAIAEANKMQGSYAPTRTEHSGPGGGPIETVNLTKYSDEQLDAIERILAASPRSGDDAADRPGGEETSAA